MNLEDENIDDLDQNDIFRELDTDLVEIFSRGQLADLFTDLPLQEQNERLDRINELLTSRNINEYFHKLREQEQGRANNYISVLWKFGLFPLPILHYSRLWRRFGPNNILESLARLATILMTTLVRIIRFGLFILTSSAYLHNILKNLFMFSNLLTFSNNFLRDIITFIFRNDSGLLERHETMLTVSKGIFYFKEDSDFQTYSLWEVTTTAVYNWVSSLINTNCSTFIEADGSRTTLCNLHKDTLIFKFSQIMNDFFPSLKPTDPNFSWPLTISTVILYLFYALGGDLICLNVLFFFTVNIGKQLLHYKDVYIGLGRIFWNTLHNII